MSVLAQTVLPYRRGRIVIIAALRANGAFLDRASANIHEIGGDQDPTHACNGDRRGAHARQEKNDGELHDGD